MPFVRLMTESRDLNQVQNNLATAINPLLNNPLLNGTFLTNVSLGIGTNVIKHGLNRTLQGWIITLNSGASTFYDLQSSNPTPQLTLELVSSAAVTVNIYVF